MAGIFSEHRLASSSSLGRPKKTLHSGGRAPMGAGVWRGEIQAPLHSLFGWVVLVCHRLLSLSSFLHSPPLLSFPSSSSSSSLLINVHIGEHRPPFPPPSSSRSLQRASHFRLPASARFAQTGQVHPAAGHSFTALPCRPVRRTLRDLSSRASLAVSHLQAVLRLSLIHMSPPFSPPYKPPDASSLVLLPPHPTC